MGLGFRVQGSGFRVQGSGFRVQGSRFMVQGSGFKVHGSRFRVQGSRYRIQGSGCRVQSGGLRARVTSCTSRAGKSSSNVGFLQEDYRLGSARVCATLNPKPQPRSWNPKILLVPRGCAPLKKTVNEDFDRFVFFSAHNFLCTAVYTRDARVSAAPNHGTMAKLTMQALSTFDGLVTC